MPSSSSLRSVLDQVFYLVGRRIWRWLLLGVERQLVNGPARHHDAVAIFGDPGQVPGYRRQTAPTR
jgi:hypothetical protein